VNDDEAEEKQKASSFTAKPSLAFCFGRHV